MITLLFTLPSTEADTIRYANTDSAQVVCIGDRPLTDLDSVRLYHWLPNGTFHLEQSHSCRGREGQPDSFEVNPSQSMIVWTTAVDTSNNESCMSNAIIVPIITTAVEPNVLPTKRLLDVKIYDIHGRLLRGPPKVSGIYWARESFSDGSKRTRKLIVVK